MNKFIGIGTMTKDAELRFLPGSGKATASFTIAIKRNYKNANGEYESDFLNAVVFGKTAENLANYTSKGSKIAIEGRLQTRSYDSKDGTKKYVTEIIVNEFTFLDSKKGAGKKENKPSVGFMDNDMTPVDDGDIPF